MFNVIKYQIAVSEYGTRLDKDSVYEKVCLNVFLRGGKKTHSSKDGGFMTECRTLNTMDI